MNFVRNDTDFGGDPQRSGCRIVAKQRSRSPPQRWRSEALGRGPRRRRRRWISCAATVSVEARVVLSFPNSVVKRRSRHGPCWRRTLSIRRPNGTNATPGYRHSSYVRIRSPETNGATVDDVRAIARRTRLVHRDVNMGPALSYARLPGGNAGPQTLWRARARRWPWGSRAGWTGQPFSSEPYPVTRTSASTRFSLPTGQTAPSRGGSCSPDSEMEGVGSEFRRG